MKQKKTNYWRWQLRDTKNGVRQQADDMNYIEPSAILGKDGIIVRNSNWIIKGDFVVENFKSSDFSLKWFKINLESLRSYLSLKIDIISM